MRYETRQNAFDQHIVPSLGDYRGEFDLDEIFARAFEWTIDTNENGDELLHTAGFECVVTDEQYWEIVEAAEVKPAQVES